jgi:hypothetical protein
MKYLFLICTACSLLFAGCEKEALSVRDATSLYCEENQVLECNWNPTDDHYFRGKINGLPFCISSPHNRYWVKNEIRKISTISTANPTFNPATVPAIATLYRFGISPPIIEQNNGIVEDFAPHVIIETPWIRDSTIFPEKKYWDEFLTDGEHPLRAKWEREESGFYFRITWSCVFRPGLNYYLRTSPDRIPAVGAGLSPAFGPRGNSSFRISKELTGETETTLSYRIVFNISCDLYYSGSSGRVEYYGRLEEGEYATIATIAK